VATFFNEPDAELLRELELLHFFDISADIMMITDFKGSIRQINQAVERNLGYTKAEVIGHPIFEFVEPGDMQAVAEEQPRCNHRDLPVYIYEVRNRHRDGSNRCLQWYSIPVAERGLFYSVGRDITALRELEQELIKSDRRRNKILESIKDGFFTVDRHWKVTYVNRVARQLGGFYSERLVDRYFWEIFPQAAGTYPYQQFQLAMEQQIPLNFESWVNAVNGWYEFNIYPTSDQGLFIYFYDLSEVINSRLQLQRMEKLQLVNQMAAGITHEVRNPLTTIRGFLQVLHENQDFGDYHTYFELMIDELDRANAIITEFLDLAKEKPSQLSLISINQVINKLQPLMEADVTNRGHRLIIELDEVPELELNDGEVRQMILNLVRNAAEAMKQPGCIRITTNTNHREVVLAVQDQGCGIPPELMGKIATPFFTTKESGTGLGLPTCFSIAKRYGARIELNSSAQEGTEVKVCFKTASG